jgi:hypothetical protein
MERSTKIPLRQPTEEKRSERKQNIETGSDKPLALQPSLLSTAGCSRGRVWKLLHEIQWMLSNPRATRQCPSQDTNPCLGQDRARLGFRLPFQPPVSWPLVPAPSSTATGRATPSAYASLVLRGLAIPGGITQASCV